MIGCCASTKPFFQSKRPRISILSSSVWLRSSQRQKNNSLSKLLNSRSAMRPGSKHFKIWRKKQELNELEAENILLKERESQDKTHQEMVTSSKFTELCLISKIRQMEDIITKGDQILITKIRQMEDTIT